MEKKWPPSQSVFFPELENLAPRDIKKYGYRLTRGMEYRLYSRPEIDKLIEEGKIVPIKEKSSKPDDKYEPGDELQGQFALRRVAMRNRYVRVTLKKYMITISWDEENNRPRFGLNPVIPKKGKETG